jgi:hypothetical protein
MKQFFPYLNQRCNLLMRNCTVLMAMAALLIACTTPKPGPSSDNLRGKGFVAPPKGSLVAVVPPLSARGLESGEALMSAQLSSQLKSAGYRIGLIDRANYADLWSQEISAVGGIFDPTTGASKPQAYYQALSNLARRICDEAKCAMLIQQRLILRPAQLVGGVAEWDGQSKEVPKTNTRGYDVRLRGTTTGVSVELTAMTAEGQLGFRGFGGATLPFAANISDVKVDLRTTLFPDDQELAEAVQIALQPMLAK